MKIKYVPILAVVLALGFAGSAFAQNKPASKKNNIVFAVLSDGRSIEPLAKYENGKLMQTVSGGDEISILEGFHKSYYTPKKAYSLIFGGVKAGSVTVTKSDPKAECSSTMAQVTTSSAKAKLKGMVMGLATDISITKPGSGLRRIPTAAERADIEKLVSAEFAKEKVSARALRYHNLTALDVDNDKVPEFVGSYWVAPSANERALLFFIASKNGAKYALGYSEFRKIKKEEVMSGEIKALDDGTYNELLLDILDYNNDGTSEIFTITQGFEGNSFTVYQLKAGKWEKAVETSNYHCGY